MAPFEQRPFGSTGIQVGVLGFGAMELRGAGHNGGRPLTTPEAGRVLNGALDAGINFVDTSPDYGISEELIGELISGRRDEYFLASKCGCPFFDDPVAPRPLKHDFSRSNIVQVVERSLQRLKTDHLDLVQFHASPSVQVLEAEDALATVIELQDQGKVRLIGTSSVLPELADHVQMDVFDSFQIPYSALQREHENLITQAGERGKGVVVRGGVAKGEPGGEKTAPSAWDAWERAGLDDLLEGESRTDFMLRYTITHPAMTTTIVGTLNPDHMASNVAAAARGPLAEDVYAEARRRLDTTDSAN